MKLVLVGIFVFVVIAVASSSCSITHRTGDFACAKQADCNNGRDCVGGFCILAGTIDGPTSDSHGNGDAGTCPSACTTCNVTEKTCTIDCAVAGCTSAVACPTGYRCDIQCDTDNSCRNGVSCVGATGCTIECAGKQACQDVTCGLGPCDVTCTGVQSCRTIACDSSCMCDVTCTGSLACAATVTCESAACKSGLGCSSATNGCHSTCP